MKTVAQVTAPASGNMASGLSSPEPWSSSPSYGPYTPTAHPGLGNPEESDGGGEGKSPGIRYITDSIIKKLTKQENLAFVRTLNLSLSKTGGKKFKFIECLDKCDRLQVLNLNHNLIEKIEKLDKLHRLLELHLSHNRIQKIEGLEHMGNLQVLNLANNNIEHIPLWLAKKLRSLQSLNLQHNNISSLHEVAKLKSLKNLTELVVAENPMSNLPHCRLFLVFHLRTLEKLDEMSVSQQEREMADQRFQMEEMERLEQELGCQLAEIEKLRAAQAATAEELKRQEALSQSLQLRSQQQLRSQNQMERELNTKNELLKRKTTELTRACQKQYELEQELAFQKIDAKFEPLPYYPDQEPEEEQAPGESPYIGKARHKRNVFISEDLKQHCGSTCDVDSGAETPGPQVHSFAQVQAEERLQQLHAEIENAERQMLRASTELQKLEDAVSQRRISEAEKEQLRQQLSRKLPLQGQLRSEAHALEGQLEHHRAEMCRAQAELDSLQNLLEILDPSDPQHAHVKAQISSKNQLLDMMSKRYLELEARLEDVLCRIDHEADEIKDLEQQLTDGQIASNEALKRDLEGIIDGLQQYLHGVKAEAQRAQTESQQLQNEKEELQRRLQDSEEQRNQLEVILTDAKSPREEVEHLQQEVSRLQRENAEFLEAQDQMSAVEGKLETQLQEHNAEVGRLKEELSRLRKLGQMEQAALMAELEKERQAKENALAQGQLAADRDQEHEELQEQCRSLQEEKTSLRRQVKTLQGQLEQARATLLSPQEVMQCLEDLRRAIGSGEYRPIHDEDVLGHGLGQLQAEVESAVSSARADREEALREQRRLTQEMTSLKEQLQHTKEALRSFRAKDAERNEREAEELGKLKEELLESQDLQGLAERRLREAESERDHLLAELEDQDDQVKLEDSRNQQQLQCLEQELLEMKRSRAAADKLAAQQLNAATEQLRSLQGTVRKIGQERAEDAEELAHSRRRIAAAAEDLARSEAEIQLLQALLRDREQQVHEVDHSKQGQQQELNRLYRTLSRQHSQTKRLREQLAQVQQDTSGNLDELMAEISALRNTLSQQSNFVSNLEGYPGGRGFWYYVPSPPNPSSVQSQGTQDSGLGLQYLPSPDRGRHMTHRGRKDKEEPPNPAARGYWIYSPHRRRHSKACRAKGDQPDSGEDSGGGGSDSSGRSFVPPPGSAIYTALPDGSPLPPGTVVYAPPAAGLSVCPGTVIYGPAPPGTQLVYGPPPSSLTVPLVQAGILLCNVPSHKEMEKEHHMLVEEVRELKRKRKKEERLGGDVQRLQELREDLEQELQELRRAVGQLHRRREALQSSVSSMRGEMVLGESRQLQHGEVLEEVQCVEKTLSRRRAELREADRLLMQAQDDLKEARAKTREMLQQNSESQKRLQGTEQELEEMERRAKDTTAHLVQASQTLRDLQHAVHELQRRRVEQEQTLRDMEDVVASRDTKFQNISNQVDQKAKKLETLLSSLQEAQGREDQHLENLKELESLLLRRRSELDRLNTEVALQQEEVSSLDRKLEQRRKDEHLLLESVELRRQSLAEVLRHGEQEARELQTHIKELRMDLEVLSAQKSELGSQLEERKPQVSLFSQKCLWEDHTQQGTLSQLNQHKTELKRVHVESKEPQDVKLQHNQRLDPLERNQERSQLEVLKRKTRGLREQLKTLEKDRDLLKDQSRNLEARRSHAERCLEVAEQEARAAEAERTRVEAELEQVKQEERRMRSLKQAVSSDTAAAQQQLEEKREELNQLMKQVDSARHELAQIGEDIRGATRRHDELQGEQQQQEEELQGGARRLQESKGQMEMLSQELQKLEEELVKRRMNLKQQEQHIQTLKQEAVETEELKQEKLHKLQSQVRALEGALAEHREKLQRVTEMEERGFQDRMKQMGQELSDRDSHLRVQAKESKILRVELQSMQEALLKERRIAEKSQTDLRAQMEEMEQERAKLQRKLVSVERVAQENHQRARRLQKELSLTSQEMLSLKEKLRAQRDGDIRRREIRETMHSLKSEVKAVLHTGIEELEMPTSDTSDSGSHKENYPQVASLRKTALIAKDEQLQGEVVREKLRQKGDHLKVPKAKYKTSHVFLKGTEGTFPPHQTQLRRRMWSQQEALSQRRHQTVGSLQGLRQRVDKLDELLCHSSTDTASINLNEHPLKNDCATPSQSWSLQSGGNDSCRPVRLVSSLPEKSLDKSW
ncbi:centriolin isoform X2 [Brienomyrus brachyistius]|uniref:centriolin isoform X2 n=1 Tax=Brienomyrus brachyistius TaxID=42636 RepID=UPI0020B2552B|nr:centriolin isoform X2 [Brienomyrus brachyistius]